MKRKTMFWMLSLCLMSAVSVNAQLTASVKEVKFLYEQDGYAVYEFASGDYRLSSVLTTPQNHE
jgi:hypothetical protein